MGATEILSDALNAVAGGVNRALLALFGSGNERRIHKMRPIVAAINALEPRFKAASDAEIRELATVFRRRLADGQRLEDLLPEAFAAVREAAVRTIGQRHYDVQLMGGIVLHEGKIAEMVTGEGKTLVATLPAFLNALVGKVHIVTVNDYLARRDAEWMGPIYRALGLKVGCIQSAMDPHERQPEYAADITYGTNNEFGFDYLRDNMKIRLEDQVQGPLDYAIIDEVDNILIDEARTPLIISGDAYESTDKYYKADEIARRLKPGVHFEVKEKERTCHLTDEGVREAERLAGVETFYSAGNMDWPHLIDQALRAHHLYKIDRDYVVQDGQVIIVDEFTGRLMHGRQWSDGLHQAVEAKERSRGVRIKEETQTLATITFQNFFRMYKKLAGMTGTAMTEAAEFRKIYKLDVVSIPTNKPLIRLEYPDVVFCTEKEKYDAIVEEIREIHQQGRPILVGTTSVEKSERLSQMIEPYGIPHNVLNAKHHAREAEIIAQAGRKGALTIATNMAGRGTDILLGGNPEFLALRELRATYARREDVPPDLWEATVAKYRQQTEPEHQEVVALGGLHVIGTERHEARRIDNQLRGRAGRQGDPGSSRFFLSLEDDLMRIFAGDWVKAMLRRLGMGEGQAIESRMVSRRIQAAQRKVEDRNFEMRKHLLEYDEVMDSQRKSVYGFRQKILEGQDCKQTIMEMIVERIRTACHSFLSPTYGAECAAVWAGRQLGVELSAEELRDLPVEAMQQVCKDKAIDQALTQIQDALEEHLSSDLDPSEWTWEGLAHWVSARWGLRLKAGDLKRIGPERLAEHLLAQAQEQILSRDLSALSRFLDPAFGRQELAAWARKKFGIGIQAEDLPADPDEAAAYLIQQAEATYRQREIELPVLYGLSRFMGEGRMVRGHDREGLVAWANQRFQAQLNDREFINRPREFIYRTLLEASSRFHADGSLRAEIEAAIGRFTTDGQVVSPQRAGEVIQWAEQHLGHRLEPQEVVDRDADQLRQLFLKLAERRYRPEISEMERFLLLRIVDQCWKDHLLAMDHLKSAIGLRGYAQVDPRVEYKREGREMFKRMWERVREEVTNLVFRLRELGGMMDVVIWRIGAAVHEDATNRGFAAGQEMLSEGQPAEVKVETIRRQGVRVGRNAPCPCGSGRKYKNCCMTR